ncbi:MAG: 4Fe-4S dicluster domain-containing protein, partial [Rhizobiaceae bacterium]
AQDELTAYEDGWRASPVGRDLKRVRNVKPLWSRFGTLGGIALGGIDMWLNTLFGVSPFGTMKHGKTDAASLGRADRFRPIDYPRPDGVVSFDRLSSVFLSSTNHEENQPVHLKVLDPALQKASELGVFAGPSARYCPAGVYEWVGEGPEASLVINAQNCVHCKTCDIKDPNQNIDWTTPQGGEGPLYANM